MLFDENDDKIRVKLSICLYDQETIIDNQYDDDTHWEHIMNDIVKAVEASYGYTFDIEGFGIYYKGKDDGGSNSDG